MHVPDEAACSVLMMAMCIRAIVHGDQHVPCCVRPCIRQQGTDTTNHQCKGRNEHAVYDGNRELAGAVHGTPVMTTRLWLALSATCAALLDDAFARTATLEAPDGLRRLMERDSSAAGEEFRAAGHTGCRLVSGSG